MTQKTNTLLLQRAGIDTYRQPVVYMPADCHVCRAEGFSALTRVRISLGNRSIIATLNVVTDADWLPPDAAGLSDEAWRALAARTGDAGEFSHPEPPASASVIRAKVYGNRLNGDDCKAVIEDCVAHRLSDLDLAAFVTACAGNNLDTSETLALTRAMIGVGERLDWGAEPILDKHCVGGLPGNRTTPIVVAIVAAAGYRIPKTSSRAITSPAGTADTMEVMAPVALDISAMRRVIDAEGGCVVWGGGLDLSPADDILIRIERSLDFDSEGQLVASILSKKAAAGSTHVLIDMPVGPTAKVRSTVAAETLSRRLSVIAEKIGLRLAVHQSDGLVPVGRGIGPALEARDVLAVLRGSPDAPVDLRSRSLDVAGAVLEMTQPETSGRARAEALLRSGAAEAKFMAICAAQGGFREPGEAPHRHVVSADRDGIVTAFDNRRISRIAKLSGAPGRKTSGVRLHVSLGAHIERGAPLYEIHAETPGELAWALEYADSGPAPIKLEEGS